MEVSRMRPTLTSASGQPANAATAATTSRGCTDSSNPLSRTSALLVGLATFTPVSARTSDILDANVAAFVLLSGPGTSSTHPPVMARLARTASRPMSCKDIFCLVKVMASPYVSLASGVTVTPRSPGSRDGAPAPLPNLVEPPLSHRSWETPTPWRGH
ncbi:hypothetical protein ANTRET_LOCUS11118 [Anthophora retusa]